jgi:hypothetical protein
MTTHLSDIALAQWLEGQEDSAALQHLEACAACRKEAVDFRGKIGAFREALFTEGEEKEFTWVRPAEEPATWRPAWGIVLAWSARAALAACLLAAVLWMGSPRPAPPAASSDAADNALLERIQADLSRQAPEALEPAELFLAQMTVTENGETEQQGGKQ